MRSFHEQSFKGIADCVIPKKKRERKNRKRSRKRKKNEKWPQFPGTQKVRNATHWINPFLVDNAIGTVSITLIC